MEGRVWVDKMIIGLVGQEHFISLAESSVLTYLKIPIVSYLC